MDIVLKGHHAEVSDSFRRHVLEKLGKVEKLDPRIIRLDVCVSEERNPRQSGHKERVEVTCVSKGPVIRAEAAAQDMYAALDIAIHKLSARLRKAADKRRIHHGQRTPESLHSTAAAANGHLLDTSSDETSPDAATEDEHGGVVVREKVFESRAMTLDDALLQMELVGHDFFLFPDVETGLVSVVYRRKGYDYGVIRLQP